MDTTFINRYEDFEVNLEAFRMHNLQAIYNIKKSGAKIESADILKIYKPGLYQMAIPLLINKGEIKKPIFYIHGKRFHPQKVLVTNISKKYSFWVNPMEIPKESGVYTISTVIDGVMYSGVWPVSNKVTFEKVDNK